MSTQLIPVFNGSISNETTLLCNARDLHAFLGIGKDFSTWIRSRLIEYGFVENQDYIVFSNSGKNAYSPNLGKTPGRRRKDYHLTLDTAKELAMVERNEKGRQIRRYFIECEKQLHRQKHPHLSVHAISDNYANRAEIIYYQNFMPIFCRVLHPGEEVISHESMKEWLEKQGLIFFTRDELKNLSYGQFLAVTSR